LCFLLSQSPHPGLWFREGSNEYSLADVDDVVALEEILQDAERRKLLAMSDEEYAQVAAFCNRYPDIAVDISLVDGTDVTPKDEEDFKVFEFPGDASVVCSPFRAAVNVDCSC
jgi:hypothetical protein